MDTTGPGQDEKASLHRYLRRARQQLVGTLDGLGEYDARRPLVRTGTNLLGLVKHVASVQLEYLGDVFGRPSGHPLPWLADDAEPDADLWVPADQSREEVLALHALSAAHADATVEALTLDAVGTVPWWPEEHRRVTLHRVLVHVVVETAQHAGHAQVLRELIDGRAGAGEGDGDGDLGPRDDEGWRQHRDRIEAAAREAQRRA